MNIPFTKAHGAGNDFLLTWMPEAPSANLPGVASAICSRHSGIGADGWMLVSREGDIRLFNADGTEPELSGNGTRCAAALLVDAGLADHEVRVKTGAGPKELKLIHRSGNHFLFEMNMGVPVCLAEDVRYALPLSGVTQEVTILNVGNPQCAVFVDEFPHGWQQFASGIEAHAHFPKRTNVSLVRVLDEHTIEVRFFERGVGETMSSGTGSTGAAAAALLRGLVRTPVRIQTEAGELEYRSGPNCEGTLTGPAVLIGRGEFFYDAAL